MKQIINEEHEDNIQPVVMSATKVIEHIRLELAYYVLKSNGSAALLIYDRSDQVIRLLYLKGHVGTRVGFYSKQYTCGLDNIQKYINDGHLYRSTRINFE
jgi:hypothetical protein